MKINFEQLKKVHFVGIGGIGVSAVAKMMRHKGIAVSGSDVARSEITEELGSRGIAVHYGHAAGAVPSDIDLLIYSAAAPNNNPEREAVRGRGIPELSYFEFLGALSQDYFTIAVSGTNGKSTTTAMLGLILEEAGFDPTVIVGSKVKTFQDGNLRLGKSKYLVVEACEYQAHMLYLSPQIIVFTNIEEDHLDYYKNLDHIKKTFQTYIERLPQDGTLVYNADDTSSIEVVHKAALDRIHALSYGVEMPADYIAKNVIVDSGTQRFSILRTNAHEAIIGNFSLQIPGQFNIYNALAAASAAFALGIDADVVKKTLDKFTGIWRRFEYVGERDGAIVISDYGHHPTAIMETVKAAREFYPNRRIILVFQPHQRNRTRKLFNEFVAALMRPDILILAEIYDVTGREAEEDTHVSSQQLFDIIKQKHPAAYFAKNLTEAEQVTRMMLRANDLIIIMGAGDIDGVARKLVV